MKQNRALQMISIANKAGKIKSGQVAVCDAVKKSKADLVIVAEDASESTKKSYYDMCRYYDTDIIDYSDKSSLGRSIGKESRAAVCVCDEGFAGRIRALAESK